MYVCDHKNAGQDGATGTGYEQLVEESFEYTTGHWCLGVPLKDDAGNPVRLGRTGPVY